MLVLLRDSEHHQRIYCCTRPLLYRMGIFHKIERFSLDSFEVNVTNEILNEYPSWQHVYSGTIDNLRMHRRDYHFESVRLCLFLLFCGIERRVYITLLVESLMIAILT